MATSRFVGDFTEQLPRPGVMCTIVHVTGSHPQEVGARMWVAADRFVGTLGGGEFERQVLEYARQLLGQDVTPAHLKDYVLCRQTGQCCGGRAQVFFEVARRHRAVHLLGAGHVGRAVAEVLAGMPLRVHLVDAREEWATPEGLPAEIQVHRDDPENYVRCHRWGFEDAACIFTHSHDLDFALATFLLREPLGYLGLIGSEHKARVFESRISRSEGGEALLRLWDQKMHCPIGTPLPSKNPKVIAVSIATELLRVWGLPAPARTDRAAEVDA